MRLLAILLLLAAGVGADDWNDPAYWGLKKGAYIPTSGNCWGGTFPPKYHDKRKQFDYEACAAIVYL